LINFEKVPIPVDVVKDLHAACLSLNYALSNKTGLIIFNMSALDPISFLYWVPFDHLI